MSRSTKPATTQSVLEAFVFVRSDKNKAIRLFYEWLDQHDAEVSKATEQRIIKLLEGHLGVYENTPDVTPDFGIEVAIGLVKALIKGEK